MKPNDRNCPPMAPTPPANYAGDPCAMLPQLYAQLYSAAGGQQTSEVREGNSWVRFAPPNVGVLRSEIRRLELLCGPYRHGRAVRAGPVYNRTLATYGAGRYGYGYGPYGW